MQAMVQQGGWVVASFGCGNLTVLPHIVNMLLSSRGCACGSPSIAAAASKPVMSGSNSRQHGNGAQRLLPCKPSDPIKASHTL